MGASDSTGRSNGTEREEEKQYQRRRHNSKMEVAATAVTIAAGVAVAAYSVSKLLSDNTDSEEKDDAMAIKAPNPSIRRRENQPRIRFPHSPPDRFTINTDGGYHSTKGVSSGYGGIKELPRGIKHLVDKDKESKVYEGKSIWHLPLRGRYKMNTDGACKPNPGGPGGYGGILRDDHGKFVCCFYGFIDRRSDGLTAEFHGILEGLRLLNRPRYEGSILETDCQAAFEWVTKRKVGSSKSKIISDCRDIIRECIELIDKNKIIVEKIVGKHANRCADKLATMALKKEAVYIIQLKDVPRDIKSFFDEDKKLLGC